MKFYKIITDADYFSTIPKNSLDDWSGIYFQFTIEHAMRYVSKKWEEDPDFLYLAEFIVDDNCIPIYHLDDTIFARCDISGKDKAQIAKKALSEKYGLEFNSNKKLMESINGGLIILETDDEYELVLSHSMITANIISLKILAEFKNDNKNTCNIITTHWMVPKLHESNKWFKCTQDEMFNTYLLIKNNNFLFQICQ